MTFYAGKSGNPRGRPKGISGGRVLALAELDSMLAQAKNKKALAKAMQTKFDDDALAFFRSIVMPLLPKESRMAVEGSGVIEWRSLLEASEAAQKVGGGGERSQRGETATNGEVHHEAHEGHEVLK